MPRFCFSGATRGRILICMNMMMTNDRAALQGFMSGRERTGEAFRAVVEGHVDWVYSAARRMVGGDGARAEDVTQAVFLLLWQRPEKVRGSLSAWLYRVVRYCAANALRGEGRRAKHERRAAVMRSELALDEEAAWAGIEPVVEEMVGRLNEREREVVLLRFYQGKSYGEMGAALGISEEAARKRVSGAVEKMRGMMRARGVAAPSGAGLAGVLGARMTSAAPAVMKAKIFAGGAGVSGSVMGLAEGARHMMWMMKLKTGLAMAVAAVVLGGSGWMVWERMAVAGPVAVVPATAAGGATAAPGAATAPDLSSPEKAMQAFCEALKSGDRGATYRTLIADPKRKATVMDEMVDLNLTMNRVLIAAQKKFGPQVTATQFGFMGIDAVGGMISDASTPDGTNTKVNGDTAELSTTVPAESLDVMPRGAREIVQIWSGAPLRLKKLGAEWRFDIDGSMKVIFRGGAAVSPQEEIAMFEELAKALDGMPEQIRTGDLGSIVEVRRAARSEMQRVSAEHAMPGSQMMLVPVAYGGNRGVQILRYRV